jgi:hypothetical protein
MDSISLSRGVRQTGGSTPPHSSDVPPAAAILRGVCLQDCVHNVAGSFVLPPRLSMKGKLSEGFDKDGQRGPTMFPFRSTKPHLSFREWGFVSLYPCP